MYVGGLTKSTVLVHRPLHRFQIVAYPVVGLTGMLLYYDCRIRGEGFDIERMAASHGGRPGAAPGAAGATDLATGSVLLQGAVARSWPVTAVHDTVAAIARQAAYERDGRRRARCAHHERHRARA